MDDQRFPDLRAFIEQLKRNDDLVVVDAAVDARLEIAEIHHKGVPTGLRFPLLPLGQEEPSFWALRSYFPWRGRERQGLLIRAARVQRATRSWPENTGGRRFWELPARPALWLLTNPPRF